MLAATLGRGRLLQLLLAAGEGGEVAQRERSARMTALHLAVWADRPREAAALAAAMRRQRLEPGEARDARGRSAAALARELGRGACESAIGRPGEGVATTRGDPGGAEERGDRMKGRDNGETPGDLRGDRDDFTAGPGGREEGVRRKTLGDDEIGLETRYDTKVELGKSTGQPRQLEAIDSEARLGGSVESEALARPTETPAEPCGVATGSQRSARLLSGRWTIPRAEGRSQGPAEPAWRSLGQQLGVVLVEEMALGARRCGATGPACPQSFPTFATRRVPEAATLTPGLPASLRPLSAHVWERSERRRAAHARTCAFAQRMRSLRSGPRDRRVAGTATDTGTAAVTTAGGARPTTAAAGGEEGWSAGTRRRGAAPVTTSSSSYPTSSAGDSAEPRPSGPRGSGPRGARPHTAPALNATAFGARARPCSWRDSLADLSVFWELQYSPSYRNAAAGPAPPPQLPPALPTRAASDVSDAAGSSGGEGKGRLKGAAARNRGRPQRAVSRAQSRATMPRKEQ
uniref:Uncharacterized protein LOC116951989 n=1 Tax=Petromyzon marinus TaxID=7757 RepID=A0AAJ7XAA9_PETMA|nr:uncharacterized protein LOC116951989 [Petromyzon marinus]